MGSNSSSIVNNINPVLISSNGFVVQPYWLIIVQLVVIQILQRLYSRYACWRKEEKRTWYIALEIAVLGEERAETSPPKYSLLDFILSLLSVAHFIYACFQQQNCSSNINYSAWKCYNSFGYRLYNYVLPSVISVLVQSTVQAINSYKASQKNQNDPSIESNTLKKVSNRSYKYLKRFLLFSTILMNTLICIVFVPFFLTNAFPLFVGFFWILIPIIIVLTLTYAIFATFFVNIAMSCKKCSKDYCSRFFLTHCAVGIQVFGCLVLSMAYNYSQYCYFGGGYLVVIGYEYQSRDTATWGRALTNSSELTTHNILAFF